MPEEIKKADIRKKAAQRETKIEDRSSSGGSRNPSRQKSKSDEGDPGREADERSSDRQSDSDSQIKKRRPRRPNKPFFNIPSTSKHERKKTDQLSGKLKQVTNKTSHFEFRLRRMLLEILDMPADVDSHLELVVEGLTDIETEFEVYEKDKDQSALYSSQIGKFLVVIRKLVVETYPDNPRSEEIGDLVRSLLQRSSHYIVKAVSDRD